jgi:hypothetical protein
MREIRLSGSEGGGSEANCSFLPLSYQADGRPSNGAGGFFEAVSTPSYNLATGLA